MPRYPKKKLGIRLHDHKTEIVERGTLRSRHGTFVDFDKIFVFCCDKYCICIDKYVFIVIKIKCVNSDRICDIVNFTTKLHIFYNTLTNIYQNTHYILSKHTNITNFDMFGTVP